MAMQIKQKYGPKGLAKVKVGKEEVRVEFVDKEKLGRVPFLIKPEDVFPADIQDGEYIVSLNAEGTKIMNINVPKGSYYLKFSHFSHKLDDQDVPLPPTFRDVPYKINSRRDGTTYSVPAHLEFTALFKVCDHKDFTGWVVPYNLNYLYAKDDITDETCIMRGRGIEALEKFQKVCGFDFEQDGIVYSDNILPEMERLLQEKDRKIIGVVNDYGFLKELNPLPE